MAEDVVVDIVLEAEDNEKQQAPPKKTIYNPHRTLYILVWLNFGLIIVLTAAFALYAATNTRAVGGAVGGVETIRQNGMQHRFAHFEQGVRELRVPQAQFNPDRIMDIKWCCASSTEMHCAPAKVQYTMLPNESAILLTPTAATIHDMEKCSLMWMQRN